MIKQGNFKDRVSVTARVAVPNRGIDAAFRCGVGEEIDLAFTVPAAQIPVGAWVIEENGGGTMVDNGDGTATYTCPDVPEGATTCQVWVKYGWAVRIRLDIVAPTSGDLIKRTGVQGKIFKHSDADAALNRPNAGFFGRHVLGPNDVSFQRIYLREGGGRYRAWDAFSGLANTEHTAGTEWIPADGQAVTAQGTVFGWDEVWTAVNAATVFDAAAGAQNQIGYADWPIKWYYNMNDDPDEDGREFTTVHHKSWAYSNGKVCVQKGTAFQWAKATDIRASDHPIQASLNGRGEWLEV